MFMLGVMFLVAAGCSDQSSSNGTSTAAGPAPGDDGPLVVYVAHDRQFSEAALKAFTQETGIEVSAKYDDEMTKSLGLVNRLLEEKDAPVADVFWNNELLGTLDLVDAGVIEPYKGTGWERMPQRYRDADGMWVGFGGRLRVWIVNTDQFEPTTDGIKARLASEDLSRVTIAKPLFGTTRTHYTVMWHLLGGDAVKAWHADVRKRRLVEARSNGHTRNLVAEGVCDIGWTDTDDYFGVADLGLSVAMVPARVADFAPPAGFDATKASAEATICIPNTAGIIKGTKRRASAEKFVDWLASQSNELRLAKSEARQIPLGPIDEAELPEDVRELVPLAAQGFDLTTLGEARKQCLDWLKWEYTE
jgi:iron(III) transport system substrate-binding protein